MVIKELDIRNFGKLRECHIALGSGLNLISGSNESGKTTTHVFIKSMLYGLRRMRGRAAQNDSYSRYEPWGNKSYYAGVLRFTSGGKIFRLSRNFYKNDPSVELICETDGEKLSVEQGDLQMLLGNVSESVFENTLSIGQLKSAVDGSLVTALRNYIVNYQESSSGDLDIDHALAHLGRVRQELERQIREERQEFEIKLRELQSQIDYLEKELLAIREKFARQNGEDETFDDQSFKKDKQKILGGMAFMLLALTAAGVVSRFHPLMVLFMALGGALTALFCGYRLSRLKKKESDKKERRHRQLWNREQLEEMQAEKSAELDNLYHDLCEVREKLENGHPLDQEVEAVNLAMTTIKELSGQQQGKIGAILQERTSEILRELTGGKYTGIHLSQDLKISIDAREAYVTPEQLSRGTLEQIYFAFRMAAGEILCQEEPLPILLDDVFVMYDEKRLTRALQWLSECGHQVILFSCHRREETLMDAFGIPYDKVNLEEIE